MIRDARLYIAAAAVLLTAIVCAWQLSAYMSNAESAQKEKALNQQLASARAQMEIQLDKSAGDLASLIQSELLSTTNSPAFLKSEFITLMLLKQQSDQSWLPEWSRTKNEQINSFYLTPLLNSWGLDNLRGDDVRLVRLETPDRRVFFVFAVQLQVKSSAGEEVKIAIGIVPASYFNNIVHASDEELIVVDTTGNSFAYSDQQYVGAPLDTHPLVKAMLKDPLRGEPRMTATLAGAPALGIYEKLRNSNLYVLVTSALRSRGAVAVEAFSRVMIVTLALALFAAAAIAFFNQFELVDRQRLENRLRVFEQRAAMPMEARGFSANKERLEGMKDLAQAVVQYLRSPLTAMLGQAQIAATAENPSAARRALQEIEKHARAGRDFLEGLAKANGLEKFDVKAFVVEEVVHQALNKVRHELRGVQIEENFKSAAEADISVNEFRQALENVLRHFAERLKQSANPMKTLAVDVEQAGPLLRLRFADNGATPESDLLRRFFEPFVVANMHMATLRALVESFNGTVRAEKVDPQGLRLEIDLPARTKTVTAEQPVADMKPLEGPLAVELPPPPETQTDIQVKDELSATEELSVVIRRPKVRGEG